MKFSLVILQAPDNGPASTRALQFANALTEKGHSITRVFFYGDGTLNGHTDSSTSHQWSDLAATYDVDLILCSTSAEKRGVSAPVNGRNAVAPGFELSGLGQLLEACLQADRQITFG